jgi:hypothetical protein
MIFRPGIKNSVAFFAFILAIIGILQCQVDEPSERKVLLSIQVDSTYLKYGKVWVGLQWEGAKDTTVIWNNDSLSNLDQLQKIPLNLPDQGVIHIFIRGYQTGTDTYF